jgi:hypothetical protein
MTMFSCCFVMHDETSSYMSYYDTPQPCDDDYNYNFYNFDYINSRRNIKNIFKERLITNESTDSVYILIKNFLEFPINERKQICDDVTVDYNVDKTILGESEYLELIGINIYKKSLPEAYSIDVQHTDNFSVVNINSNALDDNNSQIVSVECCGQGIQIYRDTLNKIVKILIPDSQ